jgi:hypothetical protein
MMATAMGKPKARAAAIVDVNAASKFAFGLTLSSTGITSSNRLEGEKPSPR